MAANEASASEPTPLISLIAKTWEMVIAGHEEIGFSDDGAYIIVHNTQRCAIHVMPMYFNHKVYASWVRGINACGFHKVPGRDHRWYHQDFHRDHPEWLERIKRRPPPSRGRPGSSAGEGRRRSKAAAAAAAASEEAVAPSTAIVPHPLSVADLHPERLQLQQAMAEEAHLERAVAQIREEDFWQRFEAVRMVHMMLTHHALQQKEDAEAARKANPTITVLHPTLASDASCPLLLLCERTTALQLCDKTLEVDQMMEVDPTPSTEEAGNKMMEVEVDKNIQADRAAEAAAGEERGEEWSSQCALCDPEPPDDAPPADPKIKGELDGELPPPPPLVVSSVEVQRLLDEHSMACGCDSWAGCKHGASCRGGALNVNKASGAEERQDVDNLPLPLSLPLPIERVPSNCSSSATADLPEAPQPRSDNSTASHPAAESKKASLPLPPDTLPLPPTLADLPLPAELPLPSPVPKQAQRAMVPCSVEACALESTLRNLPTSLGLPAALLPGLLSHSSAEADHICGSPSCPLSRYGAHTYKTCDSLPPVGSAERQYLEEYVDRCFSTMASSLTTLNQTLVACA